MGRQWGVAAPQPPAHAELGSTELTVLNLLRRDSSGSAASSAYLSSSRRSSGISPCFSSRRSSQASQSEATAHHRRLHNLSSTDSYDPISTDASRRSSEASHCGGGGGGAGGGMLLAGGCGGAFGSGLGGGGGSRGMLSLTPAQHYHLKAKYAAATGGPPPTPLPNMERLAEDGGSSQPLPPLVRPHRCSDASPGYTNGHAGQSGSRRRVLYPGEAGVAARSRRASDPVRTQAPDACSLPPVQRFSSLNNLHPLPPLAHPPIPEHCSLSLQSCARSEGNMQRVLQHSACNPSIAEHAALEALAMEEDVGAGFWLGEEDLLPDDLVQYLHSQVQSESCAFMNIAEPLASGHSSYPSMEELEQMQSSGLDVSMSYSGSHSLQQQVAERKSPSSLPIQWNEVSSGSADRSPHREQGQQMEHGRWSSSGTACASAPFGKFGNMVVQLQGPQEFPNSCTLASQPPSAGSVDPAVKLETFPNSCMEARGSRGTTGRPNLSQVLEGLQPAGGPPRQSQLQLKANGSAPSQDGLGYGWSFDHRQVPAPHPPSSSSSYRNFFRAQQGLNSSNSGNMLSNAKQQQLRRNDCSLAHQVSGLKLEAPEHEYSESGYGDPLAYQPGDRKASSFPALKDQRLPEPAGPGEGIGGADPAGLLSPGVNQVTSTVDGVAAVDFGTMLEDGFDQGSLGSGLLSPSIFQALSRTSSRLTTPRASAAFHGVAPGLNNMAIGDMSSLLTTLAEESKFLAIMQ